MPAAPERHLPVGGGLPVVDDLGYDMRVEPSALDRVRTACLALPEATERLSHGQPTFFLRGKRVFVMYLDNHHGDGRLALWCAAPPGVQQGLVGTAPEHYFVPPYVGHRGWLGVRLDRGLAWEEVLGAIEDAYLEVAPRSLVERIRPGGS